MARRAISALVMSLALASPAPARIVNHLDIDGVTALPQATMDAIGRQKWFFSHASVGSNMIDGMNDLRAANPTRYRLVTASVGYSSSRANSPPSPTVGGTVYECPRGNPGWQQKSASSTPPSAHPVGRLRP